MLWVCSFATFIFIIAMGKGQFVPGFLVESGTDFQEWPKNLSRFSLKTSPLEHEMMLGDTRRSPSKLPPLTSELIDNVDVKRIPEDIDDVHLHGSLETPEGTSSKEGVVQSVSKKNCSIVAFSASIANRRSRSSGLKGYHVFFDKVLSNTNNGYNESGSYLRCYCPGFYFFTIHGLSPLHGRVRLDLMRNKERLISSEGQYYGFGTAANSVVVRLNFGDVVYLFLAEGFLYENDSSFRGYTSFTGVRIG